MASSIIASAEIHGAKEIDDWLSDLDFTDDVELMKSMLEEPAEILGSQIKKNIMTLRHVDTGLLLDSTYWHVYKVKTEDGSYGFNAGVYENISLASAYGRKISGTDSGKADALPPLYAYWLEFGTQPHYTGAGSNVDSKKATDSGLFNNGISPKPFVAPAWNSKAEIAYEALMTNITNRMDKA